MTAVVVTDNDTTLARTLARRLRDEFFAMRHAVVPELRGIQAALDVALATPSGPVTIADTADNTGGGANWWPLYALRRGGGCASSPMSPVRTSSKESWNTWPDNRRRRNTARSAV